MGTRDLGVVVGIWGLFNFLYTANFVKKHEAKQNVIRFIDVDYSNKPLPKVEGIMFLTQEQLIKKAIKNSNIPEGDYKDLTFFIINENEIGNDYTGYYLKPGSILIRNEKEDGIVQSDEKTVFHEIGHCVFDNLPKEQQNIELSSQDSHILKEDNIGDEKYLFSTKEIFARRYADKYSNNHINPKIKKNKLEPNVKYASWKNYLPLFNSFAKYQVYSLRDKIHLKK